MRQDHVTWIPSVQVVWGYFEYIYIIIYIYINNNNNNNIVLQESMAIYGLLGFETNQHDCGGHQQKPVL